MTITLHPERWRELSISEDMRKELVPFSIDGK